jgi:hypothetical protein
MLLFSDHIVHSFIERDSARALKLPVKLFWRAQRRNAPAGMKFRERLGALFAPFPVTSEM